jgi:hypothetical protein
MADLRSDRMRAVDLRIGTGRCARTCREARAAGPATVSSCDACTGLIAATEMEIESDFRDGQTLRFHVRGFVRWLARVRTRQPAAR